MGGQKISYYTSMLQFRRVSRTEKANDYKGKMGMSTCVIVILSAVFIPLAFSDNCMSYFDKYKKLHSENYCSFAQFCCGNCENRYCCYSYSAKFDKDAQMECLTSSTMPIVSGVVTVVVFLIIIISCCTCSCCCLHKMCRGSPRPVIADNVTTTTTVVQVPYPQQPTAGQTYPGAQYPAYQQVPVQPHFGNPSMPTAPYPGQQYPPFHPPQVSGPPPHYQEAVPVGMGALPYPPAQQGYNPNQPYCNPSGPAYNPDQLAYNPDQPAYNPAYVDPHKPGY
ncbi:protein shisa-5-like isoform X1 [Polyodon spathula]|uniref:protein shisa-5-like isoform X1 n=1 Tax=Polyodon spathula TaxID=7913 RepID=UPI001B7EBAA8|nr:protein shisa-5-like isoform X1 [Polyodon spathula]